MSFSPYVGDRYGGFAGRVTELFACEGVVANYINVIKMVDNALHAGCEIKNQIETLKDNSVDEHLKEITA